MTQVDHWKARKEDNENFTKNLPLRVSDPERSNFMLKFIQ